MPTTFRSHCRSCQSQQLYSLGALVQKLQEIQLFRRQDPDELLDPQLALEVAKSAKDKLRCSDCQQPGLTFRIASDDADDEAAWQGSRPCSNCGQPIPPRAAGSLSRFDRLHEMRAARRTGNPSRIGRVLSPVW